MYKFRAILLRLDLVAIPLLPGVTLLLPGEQAIPLLLADILLQLGDQATLPLLDSPQQAHPVALDSLVSCVSERERERERASMMCYGFLFIILFALSLSICCLVGTIICLFFCKQTIHQLHRLFDPWHNMCYIYM